MFVIVHHEDTALPVNRSIGSVDQVVSTMVRVRRIESLQHDNTYVGYVVAIGILQEQYFRRACDDDATIPEFKTERVLDPCELGNSISFAIVIIIVQNDQSVIHLLERFPLGVRRPNGSPQSSLRVELNLHGVCKLWELRFIGE